MCAGVPSFSVRLLFSAHCSFHGKTFKANNSVEETQYNSFWFEILRLCRSLTACQKSLCQLPCPLPEKVPIEKLVITSASSSFNVAATLMNKLTAIQELQSQRHCPAATFPKKKTHCQSH